jgi:Uma2 family endonuclease
MSTAERPSQRFTYADYLNWPEDERWELIEGVPYAMAPAPTPDHQAVVAELTAQAVAWFRGKECAPYASPIDVLFAQADESDDQVETVVQPDLIIVCGRAKVDRRGIRGAPDFVAEILSPSSASRDQIIKAALYEKHGVREYWVIDPVERLVTIRILAKGRAFSAPRFVEAKGKLPVSIFEGFEFDLDFAFARLPAE